MAHFNVADFFQAVTIQPAPAQYPRFVFLKMELNDGKQGVLLSFSL